METNESKQKKMILVVDDESVVRDLVSGFLTKLGFEVSVAEDGAIALEKFESIKPKPCLMITDIVMPEIDGPALAEKLRAKNPNLCVLFVSSYTSKKLSISELTKPINGYLSKPFSFRGFASAVNKLVQVSEDLAE